MELHGGGRLHVGLQRIRMEQQDQAGTLMELMGGGALPHELTGLLHERGGEDRAIERRGTWHRTPPAQAVLCAARRLRVSVPAEGTQPYS